CRGWRRPTRGGEHSRATWAAPPPTAPASPFAAAGQRAQHGEWDGTWSFVARAVFEPGQATRSGWSSRWAPSHLDTAPVPSSLDTARRGLTMTRDAEAM